MAVTAYAAKGDEERIRDAGAEGYVSKPISVMKFVEAVAGLLAAAAEGGRRRTSRRPRKRKPKRRKRRKRRSRSPPKRKKRPRRMAKPLRKKTHPPIVTPAKAGVQTAAAKGRKKEGWIPDFSGMTQDLRATRPKVVRHLILASLNSTCLRATGSYLRKLIFSVMLRGFFLVT